MSGVDSVGDSGCENDIGIQSQQAAIVTTIGGGNGYYEEVSSSAEIEQVAEQKNEGCEFSNVVSSADLQCLNDLGSQSQQAAIVTTIGGTSGNYEDVSNSAEIEQVAEQENKDCAISGGNSQCENFIDTQSQTAAIVTTIGGTGGGDGEYYEDVSSSAEVEQGIEQQNSDCEFSDVVSGGDSQCENNISTQSQQAAIVTTIGGAGGSEYEDVSSSAEIEQVAEQKNEGCEFSNVVSSGDSECSNDVDTQSQTAAIVTTIGGADGYYEDVSSSAEIEQGIEQKNEGCELSDVVSGGDSECDNIVDIQSQQAAIVTAIGGDDGYYEDVSSSAEIEQGIEQKNEGCELSDVDSSDDSECENNINTQTQEAAIVTAIGGGDGYYEEVSSSAEIEQVAEQKNEGCQISGFDSECDNDIDDTQSQTAAIVTTIGGAAGGSYEDVSASAEVEQVLEQENKDCELSGEQSECENDIFAQSQEAAIVTDIGGAAGGSYKDVSSSAEIEQAAEQENKECVGAICTNEIGTQAQAAEIINVIGNGDGNYEDVSNSAEIEQVAEQENKGCESSDCENFIDTQAQAAEITNVIGGAGGEYYDVSNSAEVEQVAEQENEGCEGSDCINDIGTQAQAALITNAIGGAGGEYYDVSNSAEVEQVAEQENEGCEGSDCINDIGTQAQAALITNAIGNGDGSYEDVSNSAEVEQVAEQENKDCDGSECINFIGTQAQAALITNAIGGAGGEYYDVSNSAEVEQVAEQENEGCEGSECINFIGTQAQAARDYQRHRRCWR